MMGAEAKNRSRFKRGYTNPHRKAKNENVHSKFTKPHSGQFETEG